MGEVVSIELLLDPQSEARVRADWEALASAGLSSLAAHRALSNRPHVTLLVRAALAEVDVADAAALLPVALILGEPVVFAHGDRGVLVRRVEPTGELLRLHDSVHAAAPAGADAPHTGPGEWVPHVTLARRLRLAALPEALAILGPHHRAQGVALRRWDSASATTTIIAGDGASGRTG